MKINICHSKEIDEWIKEKHYLESVPAGAILRLEFLSDDNQRIGGMMWGRPTSPKIDQKTILQLTRMYFIDDTEPCVESKALSMARKHIRKNYPQIKGLITYASTGEGHRGVIYQADGWFEISKSVTKGNWENRPGRTNRDLSIKIKYGRTP